ncbi:MAG: hypothetical protein HC854_11960 [Flavobacterium sp.]|nr:hypothetical protein [Flavobacterium sp.]
MVIYPISLVLLFGSVLIPFGMPIYSFQTYLKDINQYEKEEINGGKVAVKYDEYYTKEKWENTMKELSFVNDSLSLSEKKSILIWGKHYGQAGAVNLFGAAYALPNAFSLHGSFYSWLPKGKCQKPQLF